MKSYLVHDDRRGARRRGGRHTASCMIIHGMADKTEVPLYDYAKHIQNELLQTDVVPITVLNRQEACDPCLQIPGRRVGDVISSTSSVAHDSAFAQEAFDRAANTSQILTRSRSMALRGASPPAQKSPQPKVLSQGKFCYPRTVDAPKPEKVTPKNFDLLATALSKPLHTVLSRRDRPSVAIQPVPATARSPPPMSTRLVTMRQLPAAPTTSTSRPSPAARLPVAPALTRPRQPLYQPFPRAGPPLPKQGEAVPSAAAAVLSSSSPFRPPTPSDVSSRPLRKTEESKVQEPSKRPTFSPAAARPVALHRALGALADSAPLSPSVAAVCARLAASTPPAVCRSRTVAPATGRTAMRIRKFEPLSISTRRNQCSAETAPAPAPVAAPEPRPVAAPQPRPVATTTAAPQSRRSVPLSRGPNAHTPVAQRPSAVPVPFPSARRAPVAAALATNRVPAAPPLPARVPAPSARAEPPRNLRTIAPKAKAATKPQRRSSQATVETRPVNRASLVSPRGRGLSLPVGRRARSAPPAISTAAALVRARALLPQSSSVLVDWSESARTDSSGVVALRGVHVPTGAAVLVRQFAVAGTPRALIPTSWGGRSVAEARAQVCAETQSMRHLATHPNICRIVGAIRCASDDSGAAARDAGLIYVLPQQGPLPDLLRGRTLSEAHVRSTFRQIFDAVSFMHSQHISHNCVRPSSFFVDVTGVVRLFNFEHSLTQTEAVASSQPTLPACHRPRLSSSNFFAADLEGLAETLLFLLMQSDERRAARLVYRAQLLLWRESQLLSTPAILAQWIGNAVLAQCPTLSVAPSDAALNAVAELLVAAHGNVTVPAGQALDAQSHPFLRECDNPALAVHDNNGLPLSVSTLTSRVSELSLALQRWARGSDEDAQRALSIGFDQIDKRIWAEPATTIILHNFKAQERRWVNLSG